MNCWTGRSARLGRRCVRQSPGTLFPVSNLLSGQGGMSFFIQDVWCPPTPQIEWEGCTGSFRFCFIVPTLTRFGALWEPRGSIHFRFGESREDVGGLFCGGLLLEDYLLVFRVPLPETVPVSRSHFFHYFGQNGKIYHIFFLST